MIRSVSIIGLVLSLAFRSDISHAQGSWATDSSIGLTPRAFLASAAFSGKIYVIGGDEKPYFDQFTDTVEIFDPINHTWSVGPSMIAPRSDLTGNSFNGKLYALGGVPDADSLYTASSEILDSITNTWSKGPALLQGRGAHSSTCLNGKIYVIGGFGNAYSYPISSMDILDINTNNWSSGPPMPTARAHLTSCALGNKIYALGGFDSVNRPLSVVEVFDPSENSWHTGIPMPVALSDCACGVVNGEIFIFGGVGQYIDSKLLEIFDTATNSWNSGPAMPSGRTDFSCSVFEDKIYALGGMIKASLAINTNDVFFPSSSTVQSISPSSYSLNFFPNPASDQLQILSGPVGTARLFDLLGRERTEANDDGSGVTLDVSHLQAGTYFLRLGAQSTKVVITR